jgi:hypothetical protein
MSILFTIMAYAKRYHLEPCDFVHELLLQIAWRLAKQLGSGPSAARISASH